MVQNHEGQGSQTAMCKVVYLHHHGVLTFNNLLVVYLLTAFGLTPSGSSTVHIYAQTVHRTTH